MKSLSPGALQAWQLAAREAAASQYQFIEQEHLLIGICSLEKILMKSEECDLGPRSVETIKTEYEAIEDILRDFEVDSTQLRRRVRKKLEKGHFTHSEKIVHRSQACKDVFERAGMLVVETGEVQSIHLLAALLETPGKIITTVLEEMGVKPDNLRKRAVDKARASLKPADEQEPQKVHPGESKLTQEDTHYLDRYGRDLTREAREGKLGPYIGRREELLQVIQTLARRSKNNPVLVGEAGVGKTAIVEALALRAAQGKDPRVLKSKRIIEINMGALIGGTKYRGEFEERLTQIIKEVSTNSDVILFIDEIHNVVGAGRAEGSMDAANIMKPALSRGELRCIGATTIAEYRRYIEADSALERRFEKVIVNEPSQEEALEILKGLRNKWEEHHQVRISDKALQAAVDLSIRFDPDHQLPDKAIDLVDKAGARTRIPILSMPSRGEGNNMDELGGDQALGGEVTEMTIAQVLADKKSMPLEVIMGHLQGMDRSRLLELEAFLKSRIVGQDDAIERVCQRLIMAHTGLVRRRGPLAVFLFLGPTGVGKTELARSLAEFLFGSADDLIRLDMSEYLEEQSVAKLIGSPPGYIGYEEEGQLTGKLRTRPYSIVLLDEIEKAHLRVFDLFLQVFDEGRLTDSKGRTADARNAIFIMTSNIYVEKHAKLGFLASEQTGNAMLEEVAKKFRAEFINRIDEQIIFRSLDEEDVRKILIPILGEICQNLNNQYQVTLHVEEPAEISLARAGYSPQYGVRELRRTVERLIQVPLSRLILSGDLKNHENWLLVCEGKGLAIIPKK